MTTLLAGFGRAAAEVGSIIIVGGNIEGYTRTMTTSIALETSKGNLPLAMGLGLVLHRDRAAGERGRVGGQAGRREVRAPMSAAPAQLPIVLEQVHVASGGTLILRGISLQLTAGAPTVLIGPNGSGKTTLLRTAMGLIRPGQRTHQLGRQRGCRRHARCAGVPAARDVASLGG